MWVRELVRVGGRSFLSVFEDRDGEFSFLI